MILKIPKSIKEKIKILSPYKNYFEIKQYKTLSIDLIKALSFISDTIIKNKNSRKNNNLVTFAIWSRKKNILLKSKEINDFLYGRGLAFHISPANVPTNFLYSFALSFLAGNSNIVRVPTRNFNEIEIFIEIFQKLKNTKYKKFLKNNIFIRYEKNDECNNFFSNNSDVRLIWGGDSTIKNLKKFKTKINCQDLVFSDKYSLAIIDCKKIFNLKMEKFKKLILNFYNDTFLYDQMACNSPHLIVWLNYNKKIIDKFWNELSKLVKRKYEHDFSTSVNRLTNIQEILSSKINNKNLNILEDKLIYRLKLKKIDKNFDSYRGYYGSFFEYNCKNLTSLLSLMDRKVQTISYYGLEIEKIKKAYTSSNCSGVDRIVPIGKSGEMKFAWDEYNLIETLSRKIEIY